MLFIFFIFNIALAHDPWVGGRHLSTCEGMMVASKNGSLVSALKMPVLEREDVFSWGITFGFSVQFKPKQLDLSMLWQQLPDQVVAIFEDEYRRGDATFVTRGRVFEVGIGDDLAAGHDVIEKGYREGRYVASALLHVELLQPQRFRNRVLFLRFDRETFDALVCKLDHPNWVPLELDFSILTGAVVEGYFQSP